MHELPFERGTYTCGAVDVGGIFYDPSRKQTIQIVKNTFTAALVAKRMVKWEDPENYYVDYATAVADGPSCAGITDPVLGSDTCPVNGYCFIVTEGVVTAAVGSGTDVTSGALMIIAVPNAAANNGKVTQVTAWAGAVGLLTTELTEVQSVVAVSHAAVSSDSTNDAQVRLCLRR